MRVDDCENQNGTLGGRQPEIHAERNRKLEATRQQRKNHRQRAAWRMKRVTSCWPTIRSESASELLRQRFGHLQHRTMILLVPELTRNLPPPTEVEPHSNRIRPKRPEGGTSGDHGPQSDGDNGALRTPPFREVCRESASGTCIRDASVASEYRPAVYNLGIRSSAEASS